MTQTIGMLGYSLAGLGSLFLFLLLLTTKHYSLQKRLLMLSAIVGMLWGGTLAYQAFFNAHIGPSLAADSLRNLSWLTLLATILLGSPTITQLFQSGLRTGIFILFLVTLALDFWFRKLTWLTIENLYLLHLGQSVLALWLLEHVYRRSSGESRWALKPLCLALGMIYVFDFVLYSDAMLTKHLSWEFWFARGWVSVVALPLILLTARRAQNWSTRIFVSREVIFHSTLLVAAGGYLLLMALAGYYIKYMGGNWGSMAQLIFFALSGLVLASLFLSDQLRRKVKVLIAKHFFANKYEYREEWTNFAEVLEDAQGSPYQIALQAMVKPFECEHAVLAVQQSGSFKAVASLNPDDVNQESQFLLEKLASHAISHDWIIDIDEIREDKNQLPFNFPPDALSHIEHYEFIVPLVSNVGVNGVCLLSKPVATSEVDWEDRDLMKVISRQLSVYLKLHHTNMELAESQQFDTFNRMSAFLVHDLKNVLAQLQLLSKNAQRFKHNPEFVDDAFETVEDAASRLNKTLTQLRQKRTEGEKLTPFDLADSIERVLLHCTNQRPTPQAPQPPKQHLLIANRERFENVLTHLIQNAQEATPNEGQIDVHTHTNETCYEIVIRDTGSGMSQEFIEQRLFKPFDTTKGNAGMGIGAYDAKKFMAEVGGELLVESQEQRGSTFTLRFPIESA